MCAILYFFLMVCNKPHANPTIIYENIKEIHILAVGGNLEFPILSHVLLRRAIDLSLTRNMNAKVAVELYHIFSKISKF